METNANGPADGQARYQVSELPPHHFTSRDDDVLGAQVSRAALAEVPWKPDVAHSVTERLARDVAAYPDQFTPAGHVPLISTPRSSAASVSGKTRQRVTRRSGGGMVMAGVSLVAIIAVVGISLSIGSPGSSPAGAGAAADALALAVEPEGLAPVVVGPAVVEAVGPMADVRSESEDPALTIVAARPGSDGEIGARVQLDWSPTDVGNTVDQMQLQRKGRGGTWKAVASAEAGDFVETILIPGKRYNFRVRSFDDAGNLLSSRRLRVVLAVRDWASARIERTPGDWSTTMGGARLGGALSSRTADAGISTSFSGSGVALVAPVGPSGGAMRVRLDGGEWVRGDLNDSEPVDHAVVFSQGLESGVHSLDIAVDEGVIALDSVLFVRTPQVWSRRS